MDEPDSLNGPEEQVVAVTEDGEVTIPKQIQETLGFDTPRRVRFRETSDGKVVVEGIPSASEMRGFATRSEASTEELATDILRANRQDEPISDPTDETTSG